MDTNALLWGFLIGFGLEFAFDLLVRRRQYASSETVNSVSQGLAEKEISALQARIKELQESRVDRYEIEAEYEAEIARLRSAVPTVGHEGLQAEIAALKNQVEMLGKSVEQSDVEVQSLNAQLAEARSSAGEIAPLRSEIEARDRQIAGLQAQLAESESSVNSAFGTEADGLRRQIMDLEATINDLQAELHAKGGGRSVLSAGTNAHQQVLEWKAKATALESDVQSLRQVSASKDQAVSESIENVRRLEGELMQARGLVQDMESKAESARLAQEQADMETVRRLEGELTEARSSIQELESELAVARQVPEPTGLAESIENARRLEDELAEAQNTILSLESELEAAIQAQRKAGLADSLERVRQLEGELIRAQGTIQVLEGELEEARQTPVPEVVETPVPEPVQHPEPEPVIEPTPVIAGPEVALETAVSTAADLERVPTATANTNAKDPLVQIIGIGHLYERKLYEAGVLRFADLADCSPEKVYEIIQPAEWQRIEPERWIAEAASLAKGA